MAELVADRVNRLFGDHLEGRVSDREFDESIRLFNAEELEQLVNLISKLVASAMERA